MADKILTLHPSGKQGVAIDKSKYEQIKSAILEVLEDQHEATFKELSNSVRKKLYKEFSGSITWYFTTVKLDLEARHILEKVDDSSPQKIRLAKPSKKR